MKDFGPKTFGELNAADYDRLHDPGTTGEAVDFLYELAKGQRVLELAIGTGRIALPLFERGITIEGMDASPDMLAKLKEKPGGEKIPTMVGDMARSCPKGPFDFAFLIFNTLSNLTSQEEQISCFQNVSAELSDGGAFLIETIVPDVADFKNGQRLRTRHLDAHSVAIETALHDPVHQRIDYQIVRITAEGTKLTPLPTRYAWPQEIDLMARLAGLQLEDRWGGWHKEPFTAQSPMHISLYRKA